MPPAALAGRLRLGVGPDDAGIAGGPLPGLDRIAPEREPNRLQLVAVRVAVDVGAPAAPQPAFGARDDQADRAGEARHLAAMAFGRAVEVLDQPARVAPEHIEDAGNCTGTHGLAGARFLRGPVLITDPRGQR